MPGTVGVVGSANRFTHPVLGVFPIAVTSDFFYEKTDAGGKWLYFGWYNTRMQAFAPLYGTPQSTNYQNNGRTFEFLSIGGGGGGGGGTGAVSGGGGGAARFVMGTVSIPAFGLYDSVDIIVGGGGSGGVNASAGGTGSDTYLSILSETIFESFSPGGGGGGVNATLVPLSGGSGGGGGAVNTAVLSLGAIDAFIEGQNKGFGNRGGTGFGGTAGNIAFRRGGGGGGAGSVGFDGGSGKSNGGSGIASDWYNGSTSVFYCAGGGGGAGTNGVAGLGGSSGAGGSGGTAATAISAPGGNATTYGSGGGGAGSGANGRGGDGAGGLFMIRYRT